MLLIAAIPGAMSTPFETTIIAYILPSAECDLKLTLMDKGILNAIIYVGMITSAFAWGYIADTKGRKKILTLGLLLDGVCVLGSAFSRNFLTLLIFKYFGGFLICGVYAVLVSYIAELHGKEHRARAIMLINTVKPVAHIILTTLATAILPLKIDVTVIGLTFHSWQIFLAVCSVPSFLGALCLSFLPESPKFLMAVGRNEEALQIFSQIYAINSKQTKENYPIKALLNESTKSLNPQDFDKKPESTPTGTQANPQTSNNTEQKGISWKDGLMQLKPLFRKPLLGLSALLFVATFLIMLGQNTFRLWLPQLFASITEFEQLNKDNGGDTSMCTILEYCVNKTAAMSMPNSAANEICEVIITPASYMNNIIVSIFSFATYVIVSFLVNLIGVKSLLIGALLICGTSGLSLYFSTSSTTTLALAAIYNAMGSISCTSIFSSTIILFPTSLRTMILSMAMMFGRLSSIFGNILFPIFMLLGCVPPFLLVGLVMYLACVLAIFLPVNTKSALK